jgi:hypothetical protein
VCRVACDALNTNEKASPMTPTPPEDRARDPRAIPTTVDLTGLHAKALEALAHDLLPGEVVTVVILGERDQAIDMLERAARQGGGNLGWIRQDPDFDSLRDDPRFQRLVAVMSGAQDGAAT